MKQVQMRFTALFLLLSLVINSSIVFAQKDSTQTIVEPVSHLQIRLSIDSAGQAIYLNNDTLFRVYVSTGMIGVEKRAKMMSERLEKISMEWQADEDSLHIINQESFVEIYYKDQIIHHVFSAEAKFENTTVTKLAEKRKNTISATLNRQLSREQTLLQYGISAAIILSVLIFINFILKRLFNRVKRTISKHKHKYLKGIRIKKFEIMDAEDELELVYKIMFVVRIIFMLLLASIAFPIIFSLFPATEPIAYKLFGYVYNPLVNLGHDIVNYLPKLFSILVIVYVVRYILKYLKILAKRIEYGRLKIKGFYPDWSRTTYEIIRILIIALTLVMVFPYLPGAQSDVFKGVSVFIGVIFSIGSTSVVGNLVAGLVLTYMRPFTMGDRIKIGEIEGEIVEKTPFVLRIKTPKNEYITMPNSNVLTSHIVNYNQSFDEGGVILFTEITIGYNVPWRKVHELLLEAAGNTEYLEKDPKPFVLQEGLEDSSVRYQINAYTKRPLYKDLIYSLLHQNIQDIFGDAGVEIMSPRYVASRDGNHSTLPNKPDEPKTE